MKRVTQSPISFLGLVIWLVAALFFLYEFFLRTFVGSFAYQIIADLKLNAETFSIIGGAYYITYAVMQIPVGILTDKFGVKLIMMIASVICAAATFGFAHATNFHAAIISRLLMGLGSSFAFVCLLVVAVTWLPKRYFGFFAGFSQFIGTMGPLLSGGPLVAFMTVSHQSWRTVLTGVAGFGLFLTVMILIVVRNKPRGGEQVLIYLRQPQPIRNCLIKLVKNQQVWFVAFYSATVYVSMALIGAIWGTAYLQARGLSQSIAADIISVAWLGYAISCPLLGALSDIARRRKPILLGCACIGLIDACFMIYFPIHHAYYWLYPLLFFLLGVAASGQSLGFATITEHVDLNTRATALGLNNAIICLFGALIPPLASYFIYHAAKSHSGALLANDFKMGFTIVPIVFGLAILLMTFCVRETYCKPQKEAILLKLTV